MAVRRSQNRLSLAVVAVILGVLVVVQLRSQNAGSNLDTLSAQELTVLVANLNTRNDQLRGEVANLEAEASDLAGGQARGETSLGQLQADLARVRAWAGLDPVAGSGVRLTINGPIAGSAVENILNELRNAGTGSIAVANVRVVPGVVVAGPAGGISVENTPLGDPFEITAIGDPQVLIGALTRAGGVIAQLAATYPSTVITVVPVDAIVLPATDRDLTPAHGRPHV